MAEEWRLSLGEGQTPVVEMPRLAQEVGLDWLVLKREDLNPTGSHKARGAAFQVSALAQDGVGPWLAISSSGNAAVAAAAYCALGGLRLAAFVAPGTPEVKLAHLRRLGAAVLVTPKALTMAEAVASRLGIPNLRPSTHAYAAEGYKAIPWELAEEAPEVEAIFTFVSSGASLVGIGRGMESKAQGGGSPWRAALHAVQGTGAAPVAGPFDADRRGRLGNGDSLLGSLGARKTRRGAEACRLIAASGGGGWIVEDDEAFEALDRLAAHGVETSLEGAAALAAATRAASTGGVARACVLLTGHASLGPEVGAVARGSAMAVQSVEEALAALAAHGEGEP